MNVKMTESSLTCRIKYLAIFLMISIFLGNPIYHGLIVGDLIGATFKFVVWAIASFLVYGVYVGWIQTGASVVRRERYLMKTGHAPLTRDDEILSQYTYFLRNTIESLVSDKDHE